MSRGLALWTPFGIIAYCEEGESHSTALKCFGSTVTQEYVPVACSWPWHPKVLGLSMAARGLWITGLCYAGTNGGVIPVAALKILLPTGADLRSIRYAIPELLESNLWAIGELTPSKEVATYEIHDFDEHCAWLYKRQNQDRERQRKRRAALKMSRDMAVTVTPEREQEHEHRTGTTLTPYTGDLDIAQRAATLAARMAMPR